VSAFVSRLAVVIVGLPVVLGLVHLGGWWLFGLAAAAAVLALDELFRLIRSLHPVAIAGFVGGLLALWGAEASGVTWMVGGFLAVIPIAFLLRGFVPGRTSVTVSIAVTTLGTLWIGLGLGYILLIRELPAHGELATFTLLLAVFAGDSAAYLGGRLFGRHRMAPTVSPGKTWEGFVIGSAVCVVVTWLALYKTGFVDGWRSFVLGGALAVSSVLGDLFESSLKRDVGVKDSGRLLAGHGGMLDRIDALLFSGAVAYYVIAAFGAA
jgi:phosphatidate cytidylyltransferase